MFDFRSDLKIFGQRKGLAFCSLQVFIVGIVAFLVPLRKFMLKLHAELFQTPFCRKNIPNRLTCNIGESFETVELEGTVYVLKKR